VFNDGYQQLIMPRFEELEEKIDQSKKEVKRELTETFKAGQQSLSNRLEVVERKVDQVESKLGEVERKVDKMDKKIDQVVASDKDQDYQIKEQRKRLDKVEIIVKAN